ncbi:hypothetical protein PUR22_30740 [Mycolicibacterium porcinum]|uniref:hypothetical protein n=1 Tax=Mycolicibacterium porcinum TaxID=39693 RepID=UPI0031F80C62
MSPTDIPPVPTPHSAEIIGTNFPTTSETQTVASALQLFEQSAASVGTGNTAEVMYALIEANATGNTPDQLLSGFTEDQRAAFDRALAQLNMGNGASVMAQDILNTKIQLNGVATTFETAVEELIASYAGSGGPNSPKNQAEFTQKYNELLQAAKDQADQIGGNHNSTQEELVSGVQKGATPTIPSTMAPMPENGQMVPGMPDGSLASLLQNVGGQVSKVGSGMPNLGQQAQPIIQAGQSVIQDLMKKLPGNNGVPISDDALSRLTKASGLADSSNPLSGPRADKTGSSENNSTAGSPLGRPLSGSRDGENARYTPTGTSPKEEESPVEVPAGETRADTPSEPATTAAPTPAAPTTTLSSGEAVSGDSSLSTPTTHVSSGDAGAGTNTLSPGTGAPGSSVSPAVPMAPAMGPMMGPMGGGLGGPGAAGGAAGGRPTSGPAIKPGKDSDSVAYVPKERETPRELFDFGADLKGLDHATDMDLVAASIVAGIYRAHRREGRVIQVAVGVNSSEAVFVTGDGLGFLAPGMRAAPHLIPLITKVSDGFAARWLGCDQPWRPLLEAVAIGVVGPFDAVVATDPEAARSGVLVLSEQEIDAVNIAAGSKDRWGFDAIDPEDIDDTLTYLSTVWGRPVQAAADLERLVNQARWTGSAGPGRYPRMWARYLLSAALADGTAGDIDDARYALRSALRVPETFGGGQ